ncbi:MAG: 4-hydroxyphenylacetate 3-hydroxylase N-terminal domain-containing protein [bacterium]|nr:4-hydroxyphenylacetate 3-hydroxylase N-terminal domain-containing protein [bacterium]
MTLKTREDYRAALAALRPNIFKFDRPVADVTADPLTRRSVESHCRAYDGAHDPALRDLFTCRSPLSGDVVHRWNSLSFSPEALVANARLKRELYRQTGTCTGAACVGWNGINTLWAVTHEVDQSLGTGYQGRLRDWALQAESRGWMVAGALTDAKGDRSRPPSQQPAHYLRVVGETAEGIVVRGYKVMIAGVAACHEILVLPGAALREADHDHAVAFALPRDADGLTVVEARRPSDGRELEDHPDVPATGITQAFLIFNDVVVPRERVFLCREHRFTANLIRYFTANYRACIGACVAGQGDVMAGAAVLMARANGLSSRVFRDKLVEMAVNNETTYALGIGAITLGERHPSGVWLADSLTAHVNKVQVSRLPYETKRLCQEIGGGIAETGCLPSAADLASPVYGHALREALTAAVPGEVRARAARLVEWLTIGAGVPGCMHGGGSPDGARLIVRALTPFDGYANLASALAGIDSPVPEPEEG